MKTNYLIPINHRIILFSIVGLAMLSVLWVFLNVIYLRLGENKINSQKNNHLTIPPTAPHVPDQLIVKFQNGYIPSLLQDDIKKQKIKEQNPIGYIVVKFNSLEMSVAGVPSSQKKLTTIDEKIHQIGVTSYKKLYSSNASDLAPYYIFFLGNNTNLLKAQEKIAQLDFLNSSEPNFIQHLTAIPNDPSYGQLWGMEKIQMPKAWDLATGSQSVLVGVIDSGADYTHPDLKDNLVAGYDFVNGDSDPTDDAGHGTHISGTIGATGNNGIGVVGVNWKVKIMPVKVCNSRGSCELSATAQGIVYAADNGVKVINMSLGGLHPCSPGSAYQTSIDHALSRGVTIVVAAGNDSTDASRFSPASCNGVIVVGASAPSDTRASFSNFGAIVNIAAPGTGIYSTYPVGRYNSLQGTSMASPHVAGAAALLLSVNPGLSPQQVKDCLVNNADPITTDRPIGPRLNVFKTLQNCSSAVPITPTVGPSTTPSPSGGATPVVSGGFKLSAEAICEDKKQYIKYTYEIPAGKKAEIITKNHETVSVDESGIDDFIPETKAGVIVGSYLSGSGTYIAKGNYRLEYTKSGTLIGLRPAYDYLTHMEDKDSVVKLDLSIKTYDCSTTIPISPPDAGGGSITPTPVTYYSCHYDPACANGNKKAIQICPLICDEAR